MKTCLLLTLLFTTAYFQAVVIRNIGCKTFENNVCLQCSTRYYLDSQAICQPVNSNCKTYNPVNGACTSCYPGFGIIEDTCLPGVSSDPNCNEFDGNICVKCSQGFYVSNGKCIAASPSCKTFNPSNGFCLTCYAGYEAVGTQCILSQSQPAIANCNEIDPSTGICIRCSFGYYFDQFGQCLQIDPNCQNFDINLKKCTSCYAGKELDINGQCVKSAQQTTDPNCKSFLNGVCQECSVGAIFNLQGVCIIVDPTCLTFEQSTGLCTSCYAGYALNSNGRCIESVAPGGDPNCRTFVNGVCQECSTGAIFNSFGICMIVDPSCKTYNQGDGSCTSCYAGFELSFDRKCVESQAAQIDPNCKRFQDNTCIECAKGSRMNSNMVCVLVNPSCVTFNEVNGFCTSCYPGFEITVDGGCAKAQAAERDPNCKTFNADTICVQCSKGAIFNPFGVCITIDPSCLTHDSGDGLCTSCYAGYELTANRKCAPAEASEGDPNCKTFNNNVCTECSTGAIFNSQRICIVVDPSCSAFDERDGSCTACYAGYEINGRACVLSENVDTRDPFCKEFLGDICIQCSNRYFINGFGMCQEVNPLCNNYDQATGYCRTCYPGFVIDGTTCVEATLGVTDQYCKTWNGDVCTQCSFGAYFLPNGKCALSNPLCKTFDRTTGNCLTCYSSFEISGTTCVKSTQSLSDPNCAEFFEGICVTCSKGFIFLDTGLCGLVDPSCKVFDTFTGVCTECYQGYALTFGSCIESVNDPSVSDPNCAEFTNNVCSKCSKNFYFGQNGFCTAVDPLCNGYNPQNGACTGCYVSYVLIGPACVEDVNFELSDPNCAEWMEGICVRCASRTWMDNQGKCQTVNINCNTYNPMNGLCTSCYPGFEEQNGNCFESVSPSSCNQFNADGTCARCGQGSYLSQGKCITIDPQCASFNENTVSCVSCYPGYSLLNGACEISKVEAEFQILNCYAYNSQNQCIKCYNRYYFDTNQCKPVNVFCKTYDEYNGACLTCYTTFTLTNGKCIN